MTSSTVAQHSTQPLNFGPEWLRALSTPDSATSIPSSGGSTNANVFKFSATKYRYSKEEILKLRANISESLTEAMKTQIMSNLKDVENIFRENIVDPLSLTDPTPEEAVQLSALSSYISGRTPGGAGRPGTNSQQSQQDSRGNRGGSISNGRGGSRGRGRDNTFGPNRPNNNNNNNNTNSDENGDNTNAGEESHASSWSRGSYHTRGGSFGNRIRSYDDREQSQTFRRSTTRQTSEDWRRPRGDEDENDEPNDETSRVVNGSTSWMSRGGPTRRGGGNTGSLDQRTKSNEKWGHVDDRSNSSSNFDSNKQRHSGWRTDTSNSDRDPPLRHGSMKQPPMPEWMDDDNDDDNQLSNATFEQDGTFTRVSSNRQDNNNEQPKEQAKSTPDESNIQNHAIPSRKTQEDQVKVENSKPKSDSNVPHTAIATESKIQLPQPTIPVQESVPRWDDEFDHSDVAKTVVESTLADDQDYSPSISVGSMSRHISMEPSMQTMIQQRSPAIIDEKQWFYRDPQNTVQGPFSSAEMERWYKAGYFTILLPVKRMGDTKFSTIQELIKEFGHFPFRTDIPTTPVHKTPQPVVSDLQKFNPMAYAATSKQSFFDDYIMQQPQSRQNPALFNRQTSMPVSTNDQKSSSTMSSDLQAYFHNQQSSSRLPTNLSNDSAMMYQQQLQRTMSSSSSSSSNTQQQNPMLFDNMQRSIRHQSLSTNNSNYFSSNLAMMQQQPQQQTDDILARLNQAMNVHGKQQDKFDVQHYRNIANEQLKAQQIEQIRLRENEERQRQLEEEAQKRHELNNNRSFLFNQLSKQQIDNKKQSSMDIDAFRAFPNSILYQNEQAKIQAQQADNIRRFQQLQEQSQQASYNSSEPFHWSQQTSQKNDSIQQMNLNEIQKQQEQGQERRSREAAAFAHQYTNSQTLPISNSSPSLTSTNKTGSWAQTLFAGSNNGTSNVPPASHYNISDQNVNESSFSQLSSPSLASYNQQATNAPKSRSTTNQPLQSETRQHHSNPDHSSTSLWGTNFQQNLSNLFWDNQQSLSANKSNELNSNKSSIGIIDFKSTIKTNENDMKHSLTTPRTQDALSRWTQIQFKDSFKDVDVPTLIQLLKDIDNSGEIIEYVQPYIGSVSKAKEFAHDFIIKRNQLIKAEPNLDNERLNEIVMAPTSSNDNSISGEDDGFQIASSNGQKKKSKKTEKLKQKS